MRKILSLVLALIAGPAFAADKGAPPPVPQGPGETLQVPFHGLYLGAALAHAAGALNDAEGFKLPRDGYVASTFIGYNHRLPGSPGIVLGVEADIGLSDISGETNALGFTVRGSSKVQGSIRGRLGIPLGSTLLYGTGGLAVQQSKLEIDGAGADSVNRLPGYVFGAGLETFPLTLLGMSNIGIRVEALRYVWDDKVFSLDGGNTPSLRQHDTHVRAGLVFRLN